MYICSVSLIILGITHAYLSCNQSKGGNRCIMNEERNDLIHNLLLLLLLLSHEVVSDSS